MLEEMRFAGLTLTACLTLFASGCIPITVGVVAAAGGGGGGGGGGGALPNPAPAPNPPPPNPPAPNPPGPDPGPPPPAPPPQPPPPTAPSAPAGLSASGGPTVNLSWTDTSSDETAFRVERQGPGSGFSSVAQLSSGVTFFVDVLSNPEGIYNWRVFALNAVGDSAPSNLATRPFPPLAPTGLAAVASGTRVDLAWTDNSSIESTYRVDRAPRGSSSYTAIATLSSSSTSYVDTSGVVDARYDYRVVAFSSIGASGFSNVASADLVPASPTGLSAVAISAKRVDLSWTDASQSETSFVVERRVGGGAFATLVTLGAGVSSYSDVSAVASTSYGYRVFASNTGGDSPPTAIASATTPPAPPRLDSFSPRFGLEAGNTLVTLTGAHFLAGGAAPLTTVTFGGIPATSVTVVNDTTITCRTPAANTAALPFVDVVLSTSNGPLTIEGDFTYATSIQSEDFSGSALPAWLEDPTGDFLISGGVCRSQQKRRTYVRTVASDYGSKDFIAEVTLVTSSGADHIGFSGVGKGAPDPSNNDEPQESFHFRVHNPGIVSGRIDASFNAAPGQGQSSIVKSSPAGSHRVRIEKIGNRALLSVDLNWTGGPFVADGVHVLTDLSAAAWYPATARVFFGAGALFGSSGPQPIAFDDMVVAELRRPPLRCDSATPSAGTNAGGVTLTVAGAGFSAATPQVLLDGVAATSVVVQNDASLTCVTSATSAGRLDLTLVTPGGTAICRQAYRALEVFFSEDFSGTTLNPNLDDPNRAFRVSGGVVQRFGLGNRRYYVRTALDDYGTRDFRYEMTIRTASSGANDILFVGVGAGVNNGSTGEPLNSVFFKFHASHVVSGRVDANVDGGTGGVAGIGNLPSGFHRARLERVGNSLTLSVMRNWSGGPFVATFSHTIPNLSAAAPFLGAGPSHLFFGHTFSSQSFDDLSISAP